MRSLIKRLRNSRFVKWFTPVRFWTAALIAWVVIAVPDILTASMHPVDQLFDLVLAVGVGLVIGFVVGRLRGFRSGFRSGIAAHRDLLAELGVPGMTTGQPPTSREGNAEG